MVTKRVSRRKRPVSPTPAVAAEELTAEAVVEVLESATTVNRGTPWI
jgi:hypothetical protein